MGIVEKSAEEFLQSMGLSGSGNLPQEQKEEPKKKKKVNIETDKKREPKTRIYLSDEQILKLKMLKLSPRFICEKYIEDFLNREEVKREINQKMKELNR